MHRLSAELLLLFLLALVGCGGSGKSEESVGGAPLVADRPANAPAVPPQPSKTPKPVNLPTTNAPGPTIVNEVSSPLTITYPPLIVNIIDWGDGQSAETDAGIPQMREKFAVLGIELDIRRFELGDAVIDPVPDVRSAFFTVYLRGMTGNRGALILVGGKRSETLGGNGSGYACQVGCAPGCCHLWCRDDSVRFGGNLWYELMHLLGTPSGQDIAWLQVNVSKADMKKRIELINRGG